MTGSAKQSRLKERLDCFVASLLAMTASLLPPPLAGGVGGGGLQARLPLSPPLTATLSPRRAGRGRGKTSLHLREDPDQTRRAFCVAVEFLHQIGTGQARLERARLEVGGDQRERIVMRRAG